MNETSTQLATTTDRPNPFALTTFDQVKEMAGILAEANMYGLKQPAQFISLMMKATEENITLGRLMERMHVFPDGKLSNRSDWLQAEFEEKAGKIIWHIRTDDLCIATFIRGHEVTDEQRARAEQRMELLLELDAATWTDPRDADKERKLNLKIGKLAREGEETVLRSAVDADSKGISLAKSGSRKDNWHTSPRSMLQWRCVSEGVKVICPRILSGMPTDIEYNDVRMLEQARKAQVVNDPKPGDEQAILGIIEQYDEELATDIPDSRRKTVQGLRADLVCKLADMGFKAPTMPEAPAPTVAGVPAKTVETTVLPPEPTTKPAPPARKTRPTPQPAQPEATTEGTQPVDTPWQEIVCHVGAANSMFLGHTLAEIFAKATSQRRLDGIMESFKTMLGGSPAPKDILLWKKAEEAKAAWTPPTDEAPKTPASASTPETAATTPPKAETPAQQPAALTGWRAYVVKGRSTFAGKRLNDIDVADLQKIKTEYLDTLDKAKMTLDQKALTANISLALAELSPPAANTDPEPTAAPDGEPEHTQSLNAMIQTHGLNRNDFMTVYRQNGYIGTTATRLQDITADEVTALVQGWDQVAAEVKAIQP